MTKLFKATLVPKKSHPDSPESIILHSDQFNTQKDFSDFCIEELKEIEDVALWFVPKIERVTQEEYDTATCEPTEPESTELEAESAELTSEHSEQIETADQYHFFQYAKGYPIIVKLSKMDDKIRAAYMFDSNQFLEIDKEFSTLENGLVNALSYVLQDCTEAGVDFHEWAKATVKGIGGRDPERFFHESIMTQQEVIDFFGAAPEIKSDTWESDDSIQYKKLYSAIVDVIAIYKGEQIPSARDCYFALLKCVPEENRERNDLETRLVIQVIKVKNPHNFTNGINATQIVMHAFSDLDQAECKAITGEKPDDTVMDRLADKFKDEPEVTNSEPEEKETSLEAEKIESLPVDSKSKKSDQTPITEEAIEKLEAEFKENLKVDLAGDIEKYNAQIDALEPGESFVVENMPNEVYHKLSGYSKSSLDLIDADPSMLEWSRNCPEDENKKDTADVGNLYHVLVSQPYLYEEEFAVEPPVVGEDGKPTTKASKYWKQKNLEFRHSNVGKTIISSEDDKKCHLMQGSVMAHPRAKMLFTHPTGRAELSIFWRDPVTGLVFKIRVDYVCQINSALHIIVDLKSVADVDQFEKSVGEYRYHVQDAFYSWVYENVFGVEPVFSFCATSKSISMGKYKTRLSILEDDDKKEGTAQYQKNIQTLVDCINSGNWGGFEQITRPYYQRKNDLTKEM